MAIVSIPEFWMDGIQTVGVTRDVSFHMKVRFDDGREEWHYFGTSAPDGAVQHPAVHFPADFLNLAQEDQALLFDLALLVANSVLR